MLWGFGVMCGAGKGGIGVTGVSEQGSDVSGRV